MKTPHVHNKQYLRGNKCECGLTPQQPKPMKKIKKECTHGSDAICIHCGIPSPKPSKPIEKIELWRDTNTANTVLEDYENCKDIENKINELVDEINKLKLSH